MLAGEPDASAGAHAPLADASGSPTHPPPDAEERPSREAQVGADAHGAHGGPGARAMLREPAPGGPPMSEAQPQI